MALRAFQSNPAIGGFGEEGGSQSDFINHENERATSTTKNAQYDEHSSTSATAGPSSARQRRRQEPQLSSESCDAFAQIVKELVDNAVDACARENNEDWKENGNSFASSSPSATFSFKRVRVEIKPTQITFDNGATAMQCLRVKVSDNGCGMEDIDDCVSAFCSSKNNDGEDAASKNSQQQQSRDSANKKNCATTANKSKHVSDSSPYTSGRYGVGLTLCLLHAQRLVPNSVTLIITSTKSSDYWTIRRYKADTEKDEIVCLKDERLPKMEKNECGTIVEVLVPGGHGARNAWPRLAEYFARFQLSLDLPCSIEVKAETFQPLPLYVRPPKEMEKKRINRNNTTKLLAVDVLINSTVNKSDVDNGVCDIINNNNKNDDDDDDDDDDAWNDGFGEEGTEEEENTELQKVSKSRQERVRLDEEKKRKVALMQKAASIYKGRVDLRDVNVAYSTQRIRRKNEGGKSSSPNATNSPLLEMSMAVFGPPHVVDDDDNSVRSRNDSCYNKTAKLQVVRMVNGIPVLDSSEALACGVITKISSSTAIWNSFGLEVSQRSQDTTGSPSFDISDSAQVVPFLRTSTHSLYNSGEAQDDEPATDDNDDDFDLEDIYNTRKRKKEPQTNCILPAAHRLGDVLIVVHIRAKPSALPLPTLSKGRLPMNDKSINDAIENAVTDCLRSLQIQNPHLLLTAYQLKKVERDVKYAPLAAGAISSILSRSRNQGLYRNTLNAASRWDDEVRKLGISLDKNSIDQRRERVKTTFRADDERARSLTLGPMVERRLRFVVSDGFKAHKKAEEMEYKRQQRVDLSLEKKAKASKAAESDGLNSDVVGSDEDCSIAGNMTINIDSPSGSGGMGKEDEIDGDNGDGFRSETSEDNVEVDVREEKDDKVLDDDSWCSEFGECIPGSFFR